MLLKVLISIQKSGAPLDRIERLNLLSAKGLRHQKSQDWIDNFGSMIGMGATGVFGSDPEILNATGTKFAIPLNLLSGLFNPVGGPDLKLLLNLLIIELLFVKRLEPLLDTILLILVS